MPSTETSDRVATILAMFTEHATDWQPTSPGHPSQAAESALAYMIDAGEIGPASLPAIHRLLETDLPPASGFCGPYQGLLRALARIRHESSLPVVERLFQQRRERGIDPAHIVETLAALATEPAAAQLLVRIVADHRPRGGAAFLEILGQDSANGALCFPALNPLLRERAYCWSLLSLAGRFQAAGTLPPTARGPIIDAVCDEIVVSVQAWLTAARACRHRAEELAHFADVIAIAAGFMDDSAVYNAVAEVVLAGGAEVAVPALAPLLARRVLPESERLDEICRKGPQVRRQLYDLMARHDLLSAFPAAYLSPEAWAEAEICLFLTGTGYPAPPNQLQCLGHAHWSSAPEELVGTYYIFTTTGIQDWQAESGRGDTDTRYLVASGPHSNSILIKTQCEPWDMRRGTRANWATVVDGKHPEKAWDAWMASGPTSRKTTSIRTRPARRG